MLGDPWQQFGGLDPGAFHELIEGLHLPGGSEEGAELLEAVDAYAGWNVVRTQIPPLYGAILDCEQLPSASTVALPLEVRHPLTGFLEAVEYLSSRRAPDRNRHGGPFCRRGMQS